MADIVITRARRSDTKRIARLLEQWMETTAISWPEPVPEHLEEWVLGVIDAGYVVIAEKSGRLVGCAGVMPSYMPWNIDHAVLRDAFFFVPRSRSEDHDRAGRAARRVPGVANALITALKRHAEQVGMPLMMAIISGTDTEKLDRWYGIHGGQYAGGIYVFGMQASLARAAA